jgi:hypothetical protein
MESVRRARRSLQADRPLCSALMSAMPGDDLVEAVGLVAGEPTKNIVEPGARIGPVSWRSRQRFGARRPVVLTAVT